MLWANHKLRIIVTSACNLDCFYCHNEGQSKSSDQLQDDLFDHLLQLVNAYPQGLEKVTFSGGEPLLHQSLEYFVSQLVPRTTQRTVVTNGLLLDERRINSLLQAGVSKFRLGVDAISAPLSRPSSIYPNRRSIHSTIQLLYKYSVPYELNVVLTDFNRQEIPGILSFCRDHRVSAKFFEHVKTRPVIGNAGFLSAEAMPFERFSDFEHVLYERIPEATPLPPDVFDGANEIYDCGGYSIRYCRYLCEFGLCYLTGTRVDPRGFVYACLVGSGRFQISPGVSLEDSATVIRTAVGRGCSLAHTVASLAPA